MVWGFIRIVIFTTGFFVGLMFFGSGAPSAASKVEPVQIRSGNIHLRCIAVVPGSHLVGM